MIINGRVHYAITEPTMSNRFLCNEQMFLRQLKKYGTFMQLDPLLLLLDMLSLHGKALLVKLFI